jgi:hypothetical protein
MTPEEVARDYDVPVEAVLEATNYRLRNAALLQKEREEDWADSRIRGLLAAPPVTSDARAEANPSYVAIEDLFPRESQGAIAATKGSGDRAPSYSDAAHQRVVL